MNEVTYTSKEKIDSLNGDNVLLEEEREKLLKQIEEFKVTITIIPLYLSLCSFLLFSLNLSPSSLFQVVTVLVVVQQGKLIYLISIHVLTCSLGPYTH